MKFLFAMQPTNDLGLLAQALPIARELSSRGHRIVFCSPAQAPARVVAANGFENSTPGWPAYRILAGDLRAVHFLKTIGAMRWKRDFGLLSWYSGHLRENETPDIWNIDHFAYVMGMGNERYVRAAVDTLSKLIRKQKPDAIVNFWNPLMRIVAEIHGIPLVSVIQADLHPNGKGFIWWKEPPAGLPTPVPAVNRVLSENGLPPVRTMADLSLGDLTLVVGIRELEPIPGSADIHYIGPLLLLSTNDSLPAWAGDLRNDKPVIWVYPGNLRYIRGRESPFNGMAILRACAEALGDMPAQVVLTAGHQALPADTPLMPANFHRVAFVPGLAMAGRSDLMIHHGGYGSCQTGLYAGTPSVIVPTYSERESNARRIAAAGAGEFVLPRTDAAGKKTVDAGELRMKIERVLSDPSYKENANKIGEAMKRYGGAPGAADRIEKLVLG